MTTEEFNYGSLINQMDDKIKRMIRDYERISKSVINKKWSITYKKMCLKENLMPKYTDILFVWKNVLNAYIKD